MCSLKYTLHFPFIQHFSAKVHREPRIYHSNTGTLFTLNILIRRMQTDLKTNSHFTTVLRHGEHH